MVSGSERGCNGPFFIMKKIDRVKKISHHGVDIKHPLSKLIRWRGYKNKSKAITKDANYKD